jgi:large subunit ribosomal protein L11
VGPALAQHGINLMQFCKEYNARYGVYGGQHHPGGSHHLSGRLLHLCAEDAAHAGPAAEGRRDREGAPSSEPNRSKVGRITRAQLREIAQLKMRDLNAVDLEGAMRQIEGTARSMGIEIVD